MNAALARRAEQVLEQAKAPRLTLATVESCTAGTLALLLADAPGAADSFHGGFVVYAKANKIASGLPHAGPRGGTGSNPMESWIRSAMRSAT